MTEIIETYKFIEYKVIFGDGIEELFKNISEYLQQFSKNGEKHICWSIIEEGYEYNKKLRKSIPYRILKMHEKVAEAK